MPNLKNKLGMSIPSSVLTIRDSKDRWLRDIKNLNIGELIELYAFAEAIVDTVRDPLVILDDRLIVKSANKSFFTTFKVTQKETYERHIYDLNSGEWNIPSLKRLLEDILPKNSHFDNYEVNHYFSRLGQKTMLLNARRIVLEGNKTRMILLAIEDITERKSIEKQRNEFVSFVVHELKTPLTVVKIFSHLIKKNLLRKNDKEDTYLIEKINKHVDSINLQINDLLDIEKINEGKLALNKKRNDLDKLAKTVIEECQSTTDNHDIIKINKLKRKVLCDGYRIQQVLTNLINNAIKYSPKGGKIIIKISKVKNYAVISVQDHGIGAAKKDLKRLFDRYYRSEDKVKNIQGFGLGLYICMQILDQHNGKIWADSIKGKGSIFYFTLPLE